MSINRKFYYFGFTIYLFSFFLPVLPLLKTPIMGYECAWLVLELLWEIKNPAEYFFVVFFNLANILAATVFILHFKVSFNKLIYLQCVAFLSSLYWVGAQIIEGKSIGGFYIGYWNWVFGIFLMMLAMVSSNRRSGRLFRNHI